MRLIGGVAIAIRCPSSGRENMKRNYVDLDLVAREKQSAAISKFFTELDYEPRKRFNAMMGRKRLIFNDLVNQRRIDIFLDVFEMSHKFDFTKRIEIEPFTLPLADLLATKLQVFEANDKDFRDMATLFLDHNVGSKDGEEINGVYLAKLSANDWGIWKTFTMNLSKVRDAAGDYGLSSSELDTVRNRIDRLSQMIDQEPKGFSWKMRARVGERVPWYELPEADKPVVSGSFD
jgi:hypothetical protein